MIQEVMSAVSAAAGIYILAKNKGKNESKKTFDQQVEEKASEMFAEKIAEQQAEEAAKDPRYRAMYFGDKEEEYDPFYDYASDPVYFNEEMLEKANSYADRMCHAFRARFVAPILIETDAKTPYSGWWTDAREGFVELNVANKFTMARDFFGGSLRYYVTMLEVFNPINANAPLKKICFKDIQVNGKDCQVWNVGGCWNEASAYQMSRMNRKWYNDTKSTLNSGMANAVSLTYIPKVYEYQCDITIPARSSVYVCVMLPLGCQPKATNVRLYALKSVQDLIDFAKNNPPIRNLFDPVGADFNEGGAARYNAYNFLEESLGDPNFAWQLKSSPASEFKENLIRRLWDGSMGCRAAILNTFEAPDSLAKGGLSAKVFVCSSDENFVQEGDPDGRDPKSDCPSFDLKYMHGSRPTTGSNQYDWQNTYFGEWEGELPRKMEYSVDVKNGIQSLADVLLDGMKIEYYDFNKQNLG